MRPLPDEYKNETDYRKIPSEYLDKVIPQGREKLIGNHLPLFLSNLKNLKNTSLIKIKLTGLPSHLLNLNI